MCPKCGSDEIVMLGTGTTWKCYECLALFPESKLSQEKQASAARTRKALEGLIEHVGKLLERGELDLEKDDQ